MRVTLIAFPIILGTLFLQHVNALPDRSGTCPAPDFSISLLLICMRLTHDTCSTDDGCPNREKCCSDGCRMTCKPPTEKIVEKTGQCPAPPGGSNNPPKTCDLKGTCKDDFECPGNQKCCPAICKKKCTSPAPPKPGSCPPVSTETCTSYAPQLCEFDSICPGTQKCCIHQNCEVRCDDVVSEVEKYGQCPAPPGGSINVPKTCDQPDLCKQDFQCPGNQKCCPSLCNKKCVAPAAPKPGSCPLVSTGMCTSYAPQLCDFDSKCPGTQKCCAIEKCGIGCVNKVSQEPKRGLCPGAPPRPYECINTDFEVVCQSDQDCDGKLKCCPSHCDMKCIPPVSEVRKGFCPVEDFGSSDTCTKFVGGNCNFDTDCEGGQKCCNFDCQKTCMKIQETKCGKCPLLTPNLQCSFKLQKPQYRCYGDSDCAPKQKCCFYGCSKECRPAEAE